MFSRDQNRWNEPYMWSGSPTEQSAAVAAGGKTDADGNAIYRIYRSCKMQYIASVMSTWS